MLHNVCVCACVRATLLCALPRSAPASQPSGRVHQCGGRVAQLTAAAAAAADALARSIDKYIIQMP